MRTTKIRPDLRLLCSHIVAALSVSKKSNNSEDQIQNTV